MVRNRETRILIMVSIFYIAVALLGVCFLDLSHSIFASRGYNNLPGYLKSLFYGDVEGDVAENVNKDPMDKLQGLESLESEEDAPDEIYEDIYEDTVYDTETLNDEVTDAPEETAEEPAQEPVEEPDKVSENEVKHYYSFKTNNKDTILRMREKPDLSSRVVYELKPRSTGYVVELGDEWSKVSCYGNEGYCSNEFLVMTEITKEEYDALAAEAKESGDTVSSDAAASDQAAPADDTGLASYDLLPLPIVTASGNEIPSTEVTSQTPDMSGGAAGGIAQTTDAGL